MRPLNRELSLDDLVGDLATFEAQHWGRQPLHRRATVELSTLLDVDTIETMLGSGARRPTFRLVHEGVTLPPERSTRPLRLAGRVVDDAADVGRIGEAMADGATLVVQGLQRTAPAIARLCRTLESTSGHSVQANAYLTPAGSRGLAHHTDDHDVIAVHLMGTKAWTVEGLGPLTMRTNDVLYVPAGCDHAAEAQEEASLHLTIGVLATTYADVLRRAIDHLAPEVLSQPLPLGFTGADRRSCLETGVRGALAAASRALDDLDVEALLDGEVERARARRRPRLDGQLGAVLGLGRIDLDTVVRRRPDQVATLDATAGPGRLGLVLSDRRLELPAVARAALELLQREPSVAVRALPGIDDTSKLVLVRRLVREGWLVPDADQPPPAERSGTHRRRVNPAVCATGEASVSPGWPVLR